MKLKINKKQQKEIAKIKKLIHKNRTTEDKLVDKLAMSMGVHPDQVINEYYEILWDYIYNDTTWTVDLEQ